MPPSEGNGKKITGPHLALVPTPPESAPESVPLRTEPPAPSVPPPSEGLELPTRFWDPSGLKVVVEGLPKLNPYEFFQFALPQLTNRKPNGALDFELRSGHLRYRLTQISPESAFTLQVSQEVGGVVQPKLSLTYLPDGQVQSDKLEATHRDLRGAERSHHQIFRNLLLERGQRILVGNDCFLRMRTALEGLQGQYRPESQSVYYENFAFSKGSLYSFELHNPMAPKEVLGDPRLSQIRIYAESMTATGSQRSLVASVSSNGEINYSASASVREPPSPELISQLKGLTTVLERAHSAPETYQAEMGRAMGRIPSLASVKVPTFRPSISLPSTSEVEHGQLGEPVLRISSGFDLFRNFHPWAYHRWENPQDKTEVRNLSPSWRLSRTMGVELMRWSLGTLWHRTFGGLFDPKPNTDYLRLHLFPQGGGELNIYRNNGLYDIIFGGADGQIWRARNEIRALEKAGAVFPNRTEALKAAVARYNSTDPTSPIFQVQEAPPFDLDRLHLDADGATRPIRDTKTAWDFLQTQIPKGVEPRVRSQLNLLGQVESVQVDFAGSQPAQTLKIKHFEMPSAEGEKVPRVEIFLQRGQDIQARVYEDGVVRPEFSRDILRRYLDPAQEGRRGGSRWYHLAGEAAHFYFIRRTGYAIANGVPFAAGHFLSLPFVRAYENSIYTEAEKRLIGTPSPQFTPGYLWDNVIRPSSKFTIFTGAAAIGTDSVFNSLPGLSRAWTSYRAGSGMFASLTSAKISGLNPNPILPPIRQNVFMRSMQRAIPLFVGLTALEYFEHGSLRSPYFWTNMRNVGLVSAGSVALTELVTRVPLFVRGARAAGMVETAAAGTAGAELGLSLRGNILLAALEFTVLGLISAHDRRAQMDTIRSGLRSDVGQALDRRNELITRLEHGEEIAPRVMIAADRNLQQAQGVYRRFLELYEKTQSTGSFSALGLENDFEDEYDLGGSGAQGTDLARDMTQAGLVMQRDARLGELRARYDQTERDLAELYSRYGVPQDAPQANDSESLRDFIARIQTANAGGAQSGSSSAGSSTVARSPIPLDSPEAEAILEQFRWKAAREPAFVLWSPDRRADYLLRQFRGYRVQESDGVSRPWNRDEALAFLSLVEQGNAERARNMQGSLTLPSSEQGYDTARLDQLLASEREIREREMSGHRHAQEHADRLAATVPDFDRQMESYYQMSNERLASALERFAAPPQMVAMTD